MLTKRKFKGGALATIGYLLSPLSWWNDVFINLPIAYVFGCLLGSLSRSLFLPSLVITYWMTNIAGLILMHRGVSEMLSKKEERYTGKAFLRDLMISITYTLLIAMLVKYRILRFPSEYFE